MRFPLLIIISILAAYGVGLYLTIPANPEVSLWREVMVRREIEIAKVRQEKPDTPIIFFTGGSSCAFSIDPKIIEETCGLPAINLGLPISSGNKYILHQAIAQTNPGDILIVCLEPDTLSENHTYSPTNLSYALAALAALDGNPADSAGGTTFSGNLSIQNHMNLSRPGPRFLITWIATAVTGKGYGYSTEDYRYHGRLETQKSDPHLQGAGRNPASHLSSTGRELLTTLKKAAEAKKVRLIYSMPWQYTKEEFVEENRINKRAMLDDIKSIMPAINDEFAGTMPKVTYFSDTALHLSAEGAKNRSQILAVGIKQWLTQQ